MPRTAKKEVRTQFFYRKNRKFIHELLFYQLQKICAAKIVHFFINKTKIQKKSAIQGEK
jgi:hypothetical protein